MCRHSSKYLEAEETLGGGSGPRTLVPRSGTEARVGVHPNTVRNKKTGVGGEGKRRWRGRKSEMERKGKRRK